ncbi:LpxL/LpxP family Kdo(2)-lipid IV(A) lauroyl/palmitoleoyl acyltransferase [Serratia ureilytica]
MKSAKAFQLALLHPRYWLTWFGLALLFLLVQPLSTALPSGGVDGTHLDAFSQAPRHHHPSQPRAVLPEMDEAQRERKVVGNFESLGMGLLETGMAWFWSDKRVKRWFNVSGINHLKMAQRDERGVLVIGVHFMSLELGGRAMGLCQPMMAMYRPHNNKAMEWAQTKGRMRSNKAMIDRKDLRGMVHALKRGEAVWFAPDQDYGPRGSVFAPLFAVDKAATTSGTFMLARMANPALVPVVLIRREGGRGYDLLIQPALEDYPLSDEQAAAAYMNKVIEKEIMRAPEQYMWLHRRFKTRPAGAPSLY